MLSEVLMPKVSASVNQTKNQHYCCFFSTFCFSYGILGPILFIGVVVPHFAE
jgi:ABC-type Fe3+-siderophore transport system permease subunit